jgi:hypothetical protein
LASLLLGLQPSGRIQAGGANLPFKLHGSSGSQIPALRLAARRGIAYFAILGFAVVMFTFFGVTYLLPGLHAYT